MQEKLYICRLVNSYDRSDIRQDIHRGALILMNPTVSQFYRRVMEVQDIINDEWNSKIYVNPRVIQDIYFKLFHIYPDEIPLYIGKADEDQMIWNFSYHTKGHDTKGRSVSEFEIKYYVDRLTPEMITPHYIYLTENYGGKDDTFYRIKYPIGDVGFESSMMNDEPILSLKKPANIDQYRFFACGALIFLQVYGWKMIPIFPKHDLGVI